MNSSMKQTTMKVKERRPVVQAEQWLPGRKVAGVNGVTPNVMCGCVILYGEKSSTPHIHPNGSAHALPVEPGDWVITDPDGSMSICGQDEFGGRYEEVAE